MFWPRVLGFEESSYSQFPRRLSPIYKYLHAKQIPHQLRFPSEFNHT